MPSLKPHLWPLSAFCSPSLYLREEEEEQLNRVLKEPRDCTVAPAPCSLWCHQIFLLEWGVQVHEGA
jgi:hypothetical protein